MRAKRVALVVAGGVLLVGPCGERRLRQQLRRVFGRGRRQFHLRRALAGTSWRLTGWSVSSQDPNDFTITAEFKDGRIGGKSAVNQYGGPYTAGDDGSISFGDLVSTMMAGSGAGHEGRADVPQAARRGRRSSGSRATR